ncbi:MAG: hypothetical protein ILP19_05070 [Oscillospiraceae bacterium]|nr:hypothetical protein [Oscillospiraceae bacterium]
MFTQKNLENDWQYYHIKESVSTFKENLDHYSEVPSKAIKSPYIHYRYQKTGKVKGVETVIVDQKIHYSTKDEKIEIENTNYYSDTRKPEKYEPWKERILYGT